MTSTENGTTRSEILETAKNIVNGQRETEYGTPEDNFSVIAEFWDVFLKGIGFEGRALTAKDVAILMCLFKIARITTGSGSIDSFVDLAGYAACGGEIFGINNLPY